MLSSHVAHLHDGESSRNEAEGRAWESQRPFLLIYRVSVVYKEARGRTVAMG